MGVKPTVGAKLFAVQEGGLFRRRPEHWVEVDPAAAMLRRIQFEKREFEKPLSVVRKLFVLELGVFEMGAFIVTGGRTSYELYVDGTFDLAQLELARSGSWYEDSLARCALETSVNLESTMQLGRDIAAACGATFDEELRTLPFDVPVRAEASRYEEQLVPALTADWAKPALRAAVARELGRMGSVEALRVLESISNYPAPVGPAVAIARERYARRRAAAAAA